MTKFKAGRRKVTYEGYLVATIHVETLDGLYIKLAECADIYFDVPCDIETIKSRTGYDSGYAHGVSSGTDYFTLEFSI